jgi:hypothetical protein
MGGTIPRERHDGAASDPETKHGIQEQCADEADGEA